jgi:DNA-binding MarR family transcriptional regulator
MDRQSATDVLAQPTRARLYALLRAADAPVDTADLAQAVGLHPNGVRTHLDQLRAAGLVTRSRAPQDRGRPRDTWSIDPGVPSGPHIAERLPTSTRSGLDGGGGGAAGGGVGSDAGGENGSGADGRDDAGRDEDYGRLAELRAGLRGYLAWAEASARDHDLTAAQFQLALVVRSSSDELGPTLTDIADALLLRHHSVVGLVDRAQDNGLVERVRDPAQPSRVHVRLTEEGARRFRALADQHLRELADRAPQMQALWGALAQPGS